jgi:hypothetical protein
MCGDQALVVDATAYPKVEMRRRQSTPALRMPVEGEDLADIAAS